MQFYVHVAPKHRVTLAMLGKVDIKTKQRDQWIIWYKISWCDIPWLQRAQDVGIIMKKEGRESKQYLKGGGQEQVVGVRRWSWTDASPHWLWDVSTVVTGTFISL